MEGSGREKKILRKLIFLHIFNHKTLFDNYLGIFFTTRSFIEFWRSFELFNETLIAFLNFKKAHCEGSKENVSFSSFDGAFRKQILKTKRKYFDCSYLHFWLKRLQEDWMLGIWNLQKWWEIKFFEFVIKNWKSLTKICVTKATF